MLEFYSDNEISKAKDIIWNCYGEELLGMELERTSAGEKTIREKEIDDIVEALCLVDCNRSEWDIVTFCSVNWRRLFRSSPEELSMLFVLDRLAVAELKQNRVSEASSSHTAQLAAMISDVSELTKAVPPLSMPSYSSMVALGRSFQAASAVQKPKPLSGVSLKGSVVAGAILGIVDASLEHRKQVSTTAVHTANNPMIPIASNRSGARKKTHNWFEHVQPATTEEVKKICEDLSPGFKYPPCFAKKLKVVSKKKSDDKKVSGAPNQRIMFVENVCRQTDDKDMEEYVNSFVSTEDFQHASVDEASTKLYIYLKYLPVMFVSYLIQMCSLKA